MTPSCAGRQTVDPNRAPVPRLPSPIAWRSSVGYAWRMHARARACARAHVRTSQREADRHTITAPCPLPCPLQSALLLFFWICCSAQDLEAQQTCPSDHWHVLLTTHPCTTLLRIGTTVTPGIHISSPNGSHPRKIMAPFKFQIHIPPGPGPCPAYHSSVSLTITCTRGCTRSISLLNRCTVCVCMRNTVPLYTHTARQGKARHGTARHAPGSAPPSGARKTHHGCSVYARPVRAAVAVAVPRGTALCRAVPCHIVWSV